MRTYGQNFSSSIDHAYINHHDGESSAISKLFSHIFRGTKTNNLKRSVSSKALLILITVLLIAITGFILSNQNTNKRSIDQLNTFPTAKNTAGVSAMQTQASKLRGAVNNTSATSTASSNNSTTVDVNGQTVTVPANSNYSQTTSSGGSTSSVTVSNHSSSAGSSASNNSSTSVNVNSR